MGGSDRQEGHPLRGTRTSSRETSSRTEFEVHMLTNAIVDDETRAEFEEMSKKSPLTQAGAAVGKSPLENFDLAGWMAGKTVGKGAESTESKEN